MLITSEDEGGSSVNEGKCADQDRRADAVVEFGRRPAKKARLLSASDDPVREVPVSSFERRRFGQGVFLVEGNGDIGGKLQGDDPMTERSSRVMNGHLSRSSEMEVAAPMYARENLQTRVMTKGDEKRGLLNYGTLNGNAGCTMPQDTDDSISTSGDESLFVIQVRSPASKQLLHGRKRSIDQEELRETNSKTGRRHDNGPICSDAKIPVITEMWQTTVQNKAKMSPDYVNTKLQSAVPRNLDAKQTGDIEFSTGTIELLNLGTSQNAPSIDTVLNVLDKQCLSAPLEQTSVVDSLGGKQEDGFRNVVPIAENGPAEYTPCDELKPDGSNQLDLGLIINAIEDAGTSGKERLAENGLGYTAPISRQEYVYATSNPVNEAEAANAAELVTDSSAKEGSAMGVSEKDEPGVNASEVLNVYVRKRKRSNASDIVTVSLAVEQLNSEDPSGETAIKHYVRRPHRQLGPADVIENPSQHVMMISASSGGEANHEAEHLPDTSATVETDENLHVFQRRPKKKNQPPQTAHHTEILAKVEAEGNPNLFQCHSNKIYSPPSEQLVDMSARVETEGNFNVFQRRSKKNPPPQIEQHSDVPVRVETKGNVNVFQRRSKMSLPRKAPSGNDIVKEVIDKHSPVGYVRADKQPNWLPEGWTLEIRQGGTATRIKDKYYHDHKSGHIFRTKNEVLQFLEGGGMVGLKVPLQSKKRPPVPIAPAKYAVFQGPLPMPSQPGLASPASPCSPFTNMQPVRMKSPSVRPTSAVASEAIGAYPTWAHVKGPNGPTWLKCDGAIRTSANTGERCQGDGPLNDGAAFALDAPKRSQLLSFGDGVQLPTGSPASTTTKSPSDQADKENRGKLIFRLKRKHPDSEGGKGRSKRPMYEVVHVEKASSSTSTPTKQEQKLATGERTGQVLPLIPDSVQTHVERVSSVKESHLSPNVVSGSMHMKAQVEKPIPLEKPCPSPVVMPTVDHQPTALNSGLETPTTLSNNAGIQYNQDPYTALGIPATAIFSGLQTYSANHTHVFLDPITNTIPLSWQYPFTSQASTTALVTTTTPTTTTTRPTLGPFPSVSGTVTTTVPVPVFEHISAVSLNATATIVPSSESGVDSRKRDSASILAKVAEGGSQVHKASKSLTKAENSKLLLDLGRHLCLTGVYHNRWNQPESVKEPHLESPVASNLEGETSLQKEVLKSTP